MISNKVKRQLGVILTESGFTKRKHSSACATSYVRVSEKIKNAIINHENFECSEHFYKRVMEKYDKS